MDEFKLVILRSVEFMYYIREKKRKLAIPVSIVLGTILCLLISTLFKLLVGSILQDQTVLTWFNAFVIVGSIALIFVAMNAFSGYSNFSKRLLENMYLSRNVTHPTWITFLRIIITVFLLGIIYNCFCPVFERIMQVYQMNDMEGIIMIMTVSFAGIFFLMTDTIMEPFRRYRAKSIAALLIMISLVFLYGIQLNYSGESSFDPYAVIIFCLGLLALLDTAINNYREMFKCLREQYGEELQAYMDSVISDFDNRFSSLEQKASTFRNDLSAFASMWKEANARKKAYLILIMLVTVAVVVILTGISLKVSGIMIHG